MTWASVSTHTNTGSKAGGTTSLAHTITTADATAGNVLIVGVGTDNLSTVDGSSNDHVSVTDSGGNVYQKLYEYTNTVGGAGADGACASLWASKLKTTLVSTVGVVTVNFSGSITAKMMGAGSFSLTAGNTFYCRGVNGVGSDASTNGPSKTVSGLYNEEHLWLAVDVAETTNTGFSHTLDADYTIVTQSGTSGGANDANIRFMLSRRIFTGTTDTHLSTSALTPDWAGVLVALREVPITSRLAATGVGR